MTSVYHFFKSYLQLFYGVLVILFFAAMVLGFLHVIRKRNQRSQNNEISSRNDLIAIFNSCGQPMLLLYDNLIKDANKAALTLFGCINKEEICGCSLFQFSTPRQDDGSLSQVFFDKILVTTIENGNAKFRWNLNVSGGKVIKTESSLNVIRLNGDAKILLILHDISHYDETISELNSGLKKAVETSKAKSDFLATMSHEIRTPLTGIIGLSELIMDSGLNDKQEKLLKTLDNEASALMAIINNVLDYSKIEAGKMKLDRMDFNFNIMMLDLARVFAIQAEKKGLLFRNHISDDIPIHLSGDPGKLRQILVNLLGNALKFTHAGTISLFAEHAGTHGNRITVRFTVIDTGIGFSKEVQGSIFDSYAQAEPGTATQYGGTGLGTTIAKKLTELMGGSMEVSSTPGRGTQFTFTAVFGQAVPKPLIQGVIKTLDRSRVLIASKPIENMNKVRQQLSSRNALIVEAETISTAVNVMEKAAFKSNPIDLVITTIGSPGFDGFDLAEIIKKNHDLCKTPVLAISPAGERGDARKCMEKGIDGYLPKPFDEDGLIQSAEALLSFGKIVIDMDNKSLITRYSIQEDYKSSFKVLLAEDYPTNQRLILHHLISEGYHAELAENGEEAVDLFKEKHFDLILMDVRMPVMDGIEACRRIRLHESQSGSMDNRTPIVALTANALKEDLDICIDAGMDHCITKPLKRKKLIDLVDRLAIVKWKKCKGLPTEGWAESIFPLRKTRVKDKVSNILIVEDTPVNQQIFIQYLVSAGYTVDLAEDGKAGVDKYKDGAYDLVIMDLNMPVMDGYTAAREIKEFQLITDPAKKIPIIAVSANTVAEKNSNSCSLFDAFEKKPIKRDRLLELVAHWTCRSSFTTISSSDNENTAQSHLDVPIDYEKALSEFLGDKPLFKEVLTGFISDVRKRLTVMAQAIENGHADILAETAHALKGGAANILAGKLSKAASDVEEIGKSGDLSKGAETLKKLDDTFNELIRYSEKKIFHES